MPPPARLDPPEQEFDVFFPSSEMRRLSSLDMTSNTYVADRHVETRLDGVAVDPEAKQVLVASPLQSSILRFDESSLEPAAAIPAMFGVRSLAVDRTRGLIICAIAGHRHDRGHRSANSQDARAIPGRTWLRARSRSMHKRAAPMSSNYGLRRRLPETSSADVAARNKRPAMKR